MIPTVMIPTEEEAAEYAAYMRRCIRDCADLDDSSIVKKHPKILEMWLLEHRFSRNAARLSEKMKVLIIEGQDLDGDEDLIPRFTQEDGGVMFNALKNIYAGRYSRLIRDRLSDTQMADIAETAINVVRGIR